MVKTIIHQGLRLAHAEATDTVAGEVHRQQLFGAAFAQIIKQAALNNTEQRLVLSGMCSLAACRPTGGFFQRGHHLLSGRRVRRTNIKSHGNIGTQILFNLHHLLRREEMLGAINVRTENYAVLANIPQFGQAEHLKTAAVGQNRLIPVHKFVQTAGLSHQLMARAHIKMIRIAQNNLRAHLIQFLGCHTFYGCLCANGHKNRCLNFAVCGFQLAQTSLAVLLQKCIFKSHIPPQ